MLAPRFRWTFPVIRAVPADLLDAGSRRGLGARSVAILADRGVRDATELEAFFAEPLAGLHDPRLLPDADRLLERLTRARDAGERVMVFGDFDADGLDGLAILVIALRRFGVAVEPYVPSRLDEGHGLSLAAVDAAVASGATVIVTVDCGTTSRDEIAEAVRARHRRHRHRPPPRARRPATGHRHRQSASPRRDATRTARLAGSGVAFKVAQLLLGSIGGRGGSAGPGRPGDDRDGRRRGPHRRREPGHRPARPGAPADRATTRLAALLDAARLAPADVDLETASPSPSRRGSTPPAGWGRPSRPPGCCWPRTPRPRPSTPAALETANTTRRDLMTTAIAEARAIVAALPDQPASIVRGPWPVGIVGLVAARLADDRARPAVVGAELGDTIRASCRSGGALDLGAALEACGDLFLRHGGHAGAAGFEIVTGQWDQLRRALHGPGGRHRAAGSTPHPGHRPGRCPPSTSTTPCSVT